MACVKPDGSLTATGLAALARVAAEPGVPALEVAKGLGKPLFIARGILRELATAGLLKPAGGAGSVEPAAETHRVTAEGQASLARGGSPRP